MAKEQAGELNILIVGFILILVGIVLSVALADEINAATQLTTETAESIAIGFNNVTVTGESIVIAGGTGGVTNADVLGIDFFGNSTVNTSSNQINFTTEVNFTSGGTITVSVNFSAATYLIDYVYNVANGSTANDDVITVSFFGNGTINTSNANINVNTHVNFTKAGIITVSGRNFTNDTYSITYGFEGDGFVVDATSRTILDLIPLFYVIGILLVSVGAALKMGILTL